MMQHQLAGFFLWLYAVRVIAQMRAASDGSQAENGLIPKQAGDAFSPTTANPL